MICNKQRLLKQGQKVITLNDRKITLCTKLWKCTKGEWKGNLERTFETSTPYKVLVSIICKKKKKKSKNRTDILIPKISMS